ncbi:H(+)/Cl(-) exchange transporter ClcA [Tatumella citrea]|uniref:Chloride channel protein n=1 Tax=Tatumella citrea TaxID=53336 RepID=A0A1Y0LAN9_TATCI|nr:H(+)/Cl(-) exchange transporter ClcA [Tatumella citrea]ARU95103.1 chloride channel protein [Tatumella citrea]ARU99142.1 chloride channel protein [Tatumella citrea]
MQNIPASTDEIPVVPLRRIDYLRLLIRKDKTPLAVLLLAGLVGILVGLVGVAFDKAVNAVLHYRLHHFAGSFGFVSLIGGIVVSALLAVVGYWLVRQFAPEAAGSGIPEIEGALEELRPVRWWRVIPVKFFGGIGTLGAGLVLGREGPTVQLGGNIGRMVLDIFRMKGAEVRHTLLATGAASGLSAAFNAPLAGILFIIEEMRLQFHYSLISVKAVFIGVIMSCIVFRVFNGESAVLDVGKLTNAPLNTLWLYLVAGMVFGIVGVIFNRLIFKVQDRFQQLHGGRMKTILLIGAIIGGTCGALTLLFPELTGGGSLLIPLAAKGEYGLAMLLTLFILRMLMTLLCFCSGAPGGIFAPMLSLGTLLGTALGVLATSMFPEYHLQAGTFAIAGMGALFAASVRAPLTGIVLVLEMTDNYQLILPMIITCLGATLLAQFLGGTPLYSTLLARTLAKQASTEAREAAQSVQQSA